MSGDVRVFRPGELLEALQQGAAGQAGTGQGAADAAAGEPPAAYPAQTVPGRHLRQRRDPQPRQPALCCQPPHQCQVSTDLYSHRISES